MRRNGAAVITEVESGIEDLLGWTPADLVGQGSTSFIHPDDQPSAVTAWVEMITTAGTEGRWRGRYRAKNGAWVWVETTNVNRLEEEGVEAVCTSIVPIDGDSPDIAEELRARTQLLDRLSDAMPVGLVQFDRAGLIGLSNPQVHTIVGHADGSTLDELFRGLDEDDRSRFRAAVEAILRNESIDELELSLLGVEPARVCSVSMRPLTAADGTVTGGFACVSDITEQAMLRRKLELQATVDALTGCLNRRAILELLEVTLRELDGTGPGVAAVFIDLDEFKSVNDVHGHAAGDDVLVELATCLRRATREPDQCGRLGGDEFLVVCTARDPVAAAEIGERLRSAAGSAATSLAPDLVLSASVGVAFTDHPVAADELVVRADEAMYAAKRAGEHAPVVAAVVGEDNGTADGPDRSD